MLHLTSPYASGNAYNSSGEEALLRYCQMMSSQLRPETPAERLAIARELWDHHGIYRQGIVGAVAYFLSGFDVQGEGLTSRQITDYRRLLNRETRILQAVGKGAIEALAFGVSFVTYHIPFERTIRCPECGAARPIEEAYPADLKWDSGRMEFSGPCNSSKCEGATRVYGPEQIEDRRFRDTKRACVEPVFLPPQAMLVEWSPATNHKVCYLDPRRYTTLRDAVMRGDPLVMYETRWELIAACCQDRLVKFGDNLIKMFTIDPPAIKAHEMAGWGCPAFEAAFPEALAVMMLARYNEIILDDFALPRRVISPPSVQARGAQMMGVDNVPGPSKVDFVAGMKRMVEHLKRNPRATAISPYALTYQVLGGEASNMATPEQLEHAESRLLYAMGIPPELVKGGINAVVSTPSVFGFTLFERRLSIQLVDGMNDLADWLGTRMGEMLNLVEFRTRLQPPAMTLADPQMVQLFSQRNAEGKLSDATFNRLIGVDPDQEASLLEAEADELDDTMDDRQRIYEKKMLLSDLVEREPGATEDVMNEKMQQQGGGMEGGGMPMPMQGGGGMPQAPAAGGAPPLGIPEFQGIAMRPSPTMENLEQTAQQMASVVVALPPDRRQGVLRQLSYGDKNLHALVSANISDMEYQGAKQGVAAVRQGQAPAQ